jgi:uncharacterized protein YlxP (DUF503 family)
VPHAYVALLLIHLHFPDAESLKEKRKELSSVKAQLHTRLGVAVSRSTARTRGSARPSPAR